MCGHLVLLFALMALAETFNPTKLGPFDAFVRHFEDCPDSGTGDVKVNVRMKKVNRTTAAADFSVELKVRYDDKISISFAMAQLTNGGYKQNFYTQFIPKACSTIMQLVPKLWSSVLKAMHAPSCPIPKGVYQAENFSTNEVMKNVTIFFYNKYKTTVSFIKQRKLIGCFQAYVDMVPKKKL